MTFQRDCCASVPHPHGTNTIASTPFSSQLSNIDTPGQVAPPGVSTGASNVPLLQPPFPHCSNRDDKDDRGRSRQVLPDPASYRYPHLIKELSQFSKVFSICSDKRKYLWQKHFSTAGLHELHETCGFSQRSPHFHSTHGTGRQLEFEDTIWGRIGGDA